MVTKKKRKKEKERETKKEQGWTNKKEMKYS
jgi:hypothetical protein